MSSPKQAKEGAEKDNGRSGSPVPGLAVENRCGNFDSSSGEEADLETGGTKNRSTVTRVATVISNDTDEKDDNEQVMMMVEEQPQDSQLRYRNPTDSKSLRDAENDASFTYSFRMPQQQGAASIVSEEGDDVASNTCFPARGNSTTPIDYKFVLDNYIEYADNTKIPRLRGENVDSVRSAIHSSHPLALCAAVTASCCLVYSITNFAPNLRNDISQAIVITMVLATFPEVAASAGAGAFAGMASTNVIPHHGWLVLLAGTTSVTWLCFHKYNWLVGYGGRLGTCAFIAMNVTVAVFVMPAGQVPWSMYGDRLWSERLAVVPSVLTVVACTFLSALGGWVRLKSKLPLNPVQAPTTIALLCMLILEPTGFRYTAQVDEGLAVGSFVAMASTSAQFLPTTLDFTAAGLIAGLWILFLDPFFLEFGGKKGFTAFCGFSTYLLLSRLLLPRRRAVAA